MMLSPTTCVDIIYDPTFCPPGAVALSPRDQVLQWDSKHLNRPLTFPPFSLDSSTSFARTTWCWTTVNVWSRTSPNAGHSPLTTWGMLQRSSWSPKKARMCSQIPLMEQVPHSRDTSVPMVLRLTSLSQLWSRKPVLVQINGSLMIRNWGIRIA